MDKEKKERSEKFTGKLELSHSTNTTSRVRNKEKLRLKAYLNGRKTFRHHGFTFSVQSGNKID